MMLPPPSTPWQVTGNHWLCLPCIHPRDASIHLIGVVNAGTRSSIEFAGGPQYTSGSDRPLMGLTLSINGKSTPIGVGGMVWERELAWLPTFSCLVDAIAVRGTIFAPFGRNADVAGAVVSLSLDNRGTRAVELVVGLEGNLGHRQSRIRSPRVLDDSHVVSILDNSILLAGSGYPSLCALAVSAENGGQPEIGVDAPTSWSSTRTITIEPGATAEESFLIAAATESDGALAAMRVMRRRGSRVLLADTRSSLNKLQQSTNEPAVDRLINRNLLFAFFTGVTRAIDNGRVYPVRSRMPWSGRGLTVTDWETLVWLLPALQLADAETARETLLRMCEIHGGEPGSGVRYIDGSMFEAGFSLEGASAYPIAVDEYIVQTSDDRVVDEPILAETLYGVHEDIERRRHAKIPLYSTELNPDGTVPKHQYTIHGNAVAAYALEVLSRTLDEKTAEKVQDAEEVRASALRHFSIEGRDGRSRFLSSSDLEAEKEQDDDPSASVYWLPYFHLVGRDDSRYRRTVKQWENVTVDQLVARCARLLGPNTSEVLEWLRRAPLDGGLAAELVDDAGRATSNGGDAALSGMLAWMAWYSVHALGAKL